MKRLIIDTVCTATVREQWEFNVPDDFEWHEATGGDDLLDESCTRPDIRFVRVDNLNVDDERDREVTNVAFEALP